MSANPYDPVTTTDSTHLADDDWGLSLPPIRYKKYSGTSRFKSFCFELRQHPKCLLIAVAAVLVIILISIIIAVASNSDKTPRPTGNEPKWSTTDEGLVFYPVPDDKTIVISFTPQEFKDMTPSSIEVGLNNVTDPYLMTNQLGPPFTDCNITYSPPDKVCRVARDHFGNICAGHNHYGYHEVQPCVFIQLNLPNDVTIQPIRPDDPLWDAAKVAVGDHSDPSNVPLTCEGTTDEDKVALNSVKGLGKDGERFAYLPKTGFPAYIYRKRNTTLPFRKPAMMVQITNLPVSHKVHITCTVWGQLYDLNNKLMDHKLLSTEFALYVEHL